MRRPTLLLLCALASGTLAAQSIQVERSDGSHLTIDNYSEHLATAFVFLSSRSPETRLALETVRTVNDRTRRRGVMFAGVFPNPAEPGEESAPVLPGLRIRLSLLS